MKLSTKIGLGFAMLVLVAVALGSLAVWTMNSVKSQVNVLAKESVPTVTVATDVERSSLLTMYEIRAFGLVSDDTALKRGQEHLAAVKKHLADAKKLGASSAHLAALTAAAEKAEAKVLEYERLVNETVATDAQLEKVRGEMNQSAQGYMKFATAFLTSQNSKLAADIKANVGAEKLSERAEKVTLINDAIDAGNGVRILAWKAQSLRDVKMLDDAKTFFATIKSKLGALRAICTDKVNLDELAEIQKEADDYQGALASLATTWTKNTALAVTRAEVAAAVLVEASNTSKFGLDDATKMSVDSSKSLGTASITMIVGLSIATLLGVVVGVLVTRSITKPINAVAETLSAGAQQTASAAGQVSAASQTLASGSSQQAASLEETSSSLEEMSSMTKRNADSAQKANVLAREARTAAESGVSDMQAMDAAMNDIKISGDGIAKIIKTIDEIAFQTNILALNAAVEAARAGEAGAGFAVVADEVRNLAQRSAVAAKETADKIQNSIDKTAHGVSLSSKVGHTLQEIASKARQVDELVAEVANASKEQTQGIDQLNSAIGQIDQVTQSNAATAEESASAAEELNAQTEVLKDSVNQLLTMVNGVGAEHTSTEFKAAPTATTARAKAPKAKGPPTTAAAPARNGNGNGSSGDHKDWFKSTSSRAASVTAPADSFRDESN